MKQKCENCVFWNTGKFTYIVEQEAGDTVVASCEKHRPDAAGNLTLLDAAGWCGEWEAVDPPKRKYVTCAN